MSAPPLCAWRTHEILRPDSNTRGSRSNLAVRVPDGTGSLGSSSSSRRHTPANLLPVEGADERHGTSGVRGAHPPRSPRAEIDGEILLDRRHAAVAGWRRGRRRDLMFATRIL